MENAYGIGVTNRYELFYVDEDGNDPLEALIQKKNTKAKQKAASIGPSSDKNQASQGTGTTNKSVQDKNKSAEKENKSSALNKNQDKSGNGGKQLVSNKQQQSGTAKTTDNTTKGKDSRTSKDRPERKFNNSSESNPNENREQRNNRRNRNEFNGDNARVNNVPNSSDREDRPPRRAQGERGAFGGRDGNRDGGARDGGMRDGNRDGGRDFGGRDGGGRRTYEGRGKREFDRQSGSDKTGVKAVDKREGNGAHNWGSVKQDIEDVNITKPDWEADKSGGEKEDPNETKDETEIQAPVVEETKEITLDEWKAQRASVRAKPQYNLRKAGEGEDLTQWKKMIAIKKKKNEDDDDEDIEYDAALYPQRVGRQKHVLDIEFHFNDGRRGGLGRGGRGRARGLPGGTGRVNNNNIGNSEGNSNQRNRGERNPGERRERRTNEDGPRENPRERFDDRRNLQNAPKVDDEKDFPSLGLKSQ